MHLLVLGAFWPKEDAVNGTLAESLNAPLVLGAFWPRGVSGSSR